MNRRNRTQLGLGLLLILALGLDSLRRAVIRRAVSEGRL